MKNDGSKKVVDQKGFRNRFQVKRGKNVSKQNDDIIVRRIVQRTTNCFEATNDNEKGTKTVRKMSEKKESQC